MKQFTFSAQVANNLLTLLQGYSKTIRLLLVMFLTLTASTTWAETVTYTVNSTTEVATSGTAPDGSSAAYNSTYSTKCQLTNGNSMTLTLSGYDGCKITGLTLSMKSNSSKGAGNMSMKIGNTTISSIATSNFNSGNWNGSWSTSYVDVTPSVTATTVGNGQSIVITIAATVNSLYCQSFTLTYTPSAAPSYTITATSNNNSYGTVSVSGTTITATPNDGYRVKSGDAGYTVTSGAAVVTNNGNNTFSVTPSSNCTITINFEEIPTYTINWHTAVGTVEDEVLEEGATITKPATDPTMTGYEFMGWTEDCEVASDGAGFTAITNFGTATEDKDYYAVFAEATTTGGGGGSTTELFSEDFSSITSGNSTETTGSSSAWDHNENFFSVTNAYQAGGAVKIGSSKNAGALVTKQLTAAVGETLTISFKVKGWSSVEGDIQVSGNNSEFAQPAAITYTSTMSGSFETKTVSVVLTKANPYIKIATTAKRAFIDDIVITKTTSGGGGTTTYDNYITTCAGAEPEPDPIPVTGVSLDITSHTMNEGETVTLTATVLPANADDPSVSWESNNEAVAKVNNGVVTAVSPGNATITVTTTDGGHTATSTITVNALPTVEGTWTLVTNAANLKAGDRIVIAAADSDFALSTTQNTNNRGQASVTKNGDNITFTEATQILTLEAGTVDNTLAFNTGAGYLHAASSSSNYLRTQATNNENGSWSISIENTGVATVVAQGTYTRNTMQYNKQSGLFACYASAAQQSIAIYKEGGGTTTYTITSTLSHVTANGENPTTITSEAEDLTLRYSAESGWNLPDAISVTMGGNQLMLNDEYTWDKETGNVWIVPASGFTGNIVVTINGWQQLATPTGLNFTNITSTSATLSWGEVANASSYTVSVYGENDEVIAEYPGLTEITKTVSDLDPETNYVFGVVAVGDGITYTNSIQAVSDVFTTSAAASPATITLSELGVTKTISTYSVGDQYTLPTTSSQSCDGKQLVGWSTVEVAETNTKPTSNYYELGAKVTLAATQTFYAVFATKGGVPSTDYNQITSIEDLTDGNYVIAYGYNTTSPTIILKAETKDETTLVATSAGPTDNKYTDPAASNIWEIKKTNTTYTLYNAATSKYIQATNTPSLKLADADPTEFQISYSTDHWKIKLNTANTYQLVGYTNASGNYFQTKESPSNSYKIQLYKSASTVVYSAYSTSCIPTYSITYDFAGGTGSHCSNTSVPQGDPYTICDEAPTKEGNTFLHWSDGTSTYAAGATFTPTKNTTLTAQWQINTYTVTWSNNGVPTPVEYNHGVALVVPEAPESCDGVKEFVGWTTHSGYYHATTAPDDIFTTKTTPVTAPATYYAVFATKGAGGTEFVLGESGTFKMYANVNGTNYYAQGGVSSSQITSTTNALSASEYTLTHTVSNKYTIQFGNAYIGHSGSTSTNLNTTETLWTITAGENGSWRITSPVNESRALAYRASTYNIFKAYSMTNVEAGDTEYFDIEFGTGSSGYSDYTTICQTVESIEIANYTTEFFVTDEFAFGGTVTAHFDEGEPQDVTALAHFSGYNMEAIGTQTVTVTYMGATATYEITVKPLDNAWVLTWNVSGKTNTGLGPRSVTKGSAIGTLPIPEVPAACAGKTFMGWTESNIVPSDGKGIVYITEATVPSKNTTYYAVFATINNFSTQAAIEDIEDGSKVVIVAVASMDASGGSGQAISSRTISITSRGVIGLSGDEVSIFDETINTPHSTCIWTLTKEGGGIVFEQGGKYIRAVDGGYRRLLLETTKDYWTLSPVEGKDKTYHMQSGNTSHYVEWFDHTDSQYAEGERYIGFIPYTVANDYGDFDMQFYVTANKDGDADITDYTTGCAEYTITYYGFHGGYSTSCSSDGTIVLPVNSLHTVPNCGDVVKDHTNLGREFLNVWMTQPHGGHTFKPGDTFILTQDTTLYAQWKMETTSDVTTLPTDIEDLAGTDIYVYGGTTLNIQPGTTTINSLTLKGGLQEDGSYKMPTVWVPEGATLVRNSNKINLDLIVNAKTWYPFAVPFATKNNQYVEYLNPELAAASTYGTHFAIKTYNGARRAEVGEDKTNNWVRVLRDETLQPGVGYIITALTYPDKDTATIRIPMTVPNTWFQNGEQAAVSTTVRNTIAVTAHGGTAANEHQRHAGWNFVANPYLTSFAGGNVANDGDLAYINGELIIEGSYVYGGDPVPYVTVPAYDFAYYSQHKLSEVKLSPEWSFFVQVGTGGTMNFTTAGRQQAPASIAARNAEERPVKMDVDLILSDNHSSDQTGIIISDRYTDAYEIGRDLEKLFGSAYNLSVYTLMEDNTPLAFQALAIRSSMQVIPVGYRAPEQGEYTFRLNEATSSIDLLNEQYEQLVLVDYQTGELTNLLYTDYTFYSERTQSNSRFAIYAVPRQNAPTDLPNAIGSDEEVRKVIYNDRLYILRDGNVYNGMGQKM